MSRAASALLRSDRRVLHARLRIDAQAPRHRLVFNIKEALRLTSLPGEDQGRTYYFRHLRIDGLPEDGDCQVWMEAFQRSLFDQAEYAVHGLDVSAENSSVVYFASEQEACQSLLSAILHKRLLADTWFWPAISQASHHDGPATHAVRIIQKLAASPSSWLAVAVALFAGGNPVSLLSLFEAETVRSWLIEMGDTEPTSASSATQPIPDPSPVTVAAQKALLEAGVIPGSPVLENPDPRLLWLTSLAIIRANPGELNRRSAPASARRALAAMHTSEAVRLSANASRNNEEITRTAAIFSREERLSVPEAPSSTNDHSRNQQPLSSLTTRQQSSTPDTGVEPAPPNHARTSDALVSKSPSSNADASLAAISPYAAPLASKAAFERAALGAKTGNAGLYFLLNALTDLGIRDAEIPISFLARLFQLIATRVSVADDDPIRLWTLLALEETPPQPVDQRELRRWAWRVRKWCWRQAKISLHDVVRRPGFVTLTRTDLDVSLPLASVDIRIRRVGLDLDPGWLPWLGRVVRFHYLSSEEIPAED